MAIRRLIRTYQWHNRPFIRVAHGTAGVIDGESTRRIETSIRSKLYCVHACIPSSSKGTLHLARGKVLRNCTRDVFALASLQQIIQSSSCLVVACMPTHAT